MSPDNNNITPDLLKLSLRPEALEMVKRLLLSCSDRRTISPELFTTNGEIDLIELGKLAPGGIAATIASHACGHGPIGSITEADVIEAFAVGHAGSVVDFIHNFTAPRIALTPAVRYYQDKGLDLTTERNKAWFLFLELANSMILTGRQDDDLFTAIYDYRDARIGINGLYLPRSLTASVGDRIVTHMGCIVATPSNNPSLTSHVLDEIASRQADNLEAIGKLGVGIDGSMIVLALTGSLQQSPYRKLHGETLDCRMGLGLNIPELLRGNFLNGPRR